MKTKAIVFSSIKYQDRSLIVKCFTLSDGLRSYFVRSAFSSSKKNNKKPSYFQPLTLLEIEARHRNKGTLEYFDEIKPIAYQSIPYDLVKGTMVLFLSEVFTQSIKEEEKNEELFIFLEAALLWLDQHAPNPNFHLLVLLELTKFLGFYPNIDSKDFFDMSEGVFMNLETPSCLTQTQTQLLKTLLSLKIFTIENPFDNSQRKELLEILIRYYALHIDEFRKPNSLEILSEVFRG